MKALIFFIVILLGTYQQGVTQQIVRGRVLSATDHKPLAGASVGIKSTSLGTSTDLEGRFSLRITTPEAVLMVSFLGYKFREIQVGASSGDSLELLLQEDLNQMQEVVVSTGYQQISAERATGSFVHLDNRLLNNRVSTDIVSRLEDVTSGLIFNRNQSGAKNDLSIRGRGTLFANSQPLIILDNFPYDGDLNGINPNDVQDITVLKDAAAASIWGARAGNGVVVITTKKGAYNRPVKFSVNSNVTVGNKPDLFYQSQMTVSDFIDMEKTLFGRGYYQTKELSDRNEALSPVIELLIARRDGKIPAELADSRIEALKEQDVRNDINRNLYQKSINQQYAFNLSGGGQNQRYFVSAGYDRNESNLSGNNYRRLTANAVNTYALLKQKLELTTGLQYSSSQDRQNNSGFVSWNSGQNLYPYASLADANGKALSVIKDYRSSFTESAEEKGLLDWQYRPLEEISLNDNLAELSEYRINATLNYKIIRDLSAELQYQYNSSRSDIRNLHDQESYYTRNLINQFTQTGLDGSLSRPVPIGGILDMSSGKGSVLNLRAQLSYNHDWRERHLLSSIAGYELRDQNRLTNISRLYGYDDEHASGQIVDYLNPYRYFNSSSATGFIKNNDAARDLTDRFLSYYANAAYTYNRRYSVSASGRLDRSNLFGVDANQQGVPLWSAGIGWNLSSESFYNIKALPYLKLRATFGYNGNIDRSLSAYTTALYTPAALYTRLAFADIINPPNPSLRWERVKILNFGLDFNSRNSRLSGSIDYYKKKGLDLIGSTPFPSSTGILTFRGNAADTQGDGVDLVLNTRPVDREFKWFSNLLFSYGREIVSKYSVKASVTGYLESGSANLYPLEGRPLSAIYSYKWSGLEPATGDPSGFIDGLPSKNYLSIIQTATPESLVYHGTAASMASPSCWPTTR